MEEEPTHFELRDVVHDVLRSKEDDLENVIQSHDRSLKELFLMTKQRNNMVHKEYAHRRDGGNDKSLEGYEDWERKYKLGEGSSIKMLGIPNLPPISPPSTTRVYPDEPASADLAASSSSSIPKPVTVTPTEGGYSSLTTAPIEAEGPIEPYISLSDIQPRPFVMREFSPTPKLSMAEWMPVDNYRPAQGPETPPELLMPLESSYAASLPPLPPVPAIALDGQQPSKRRKRGANNQSDMFKLQASFSLNPLSSALNRSTKCVLTSDWKVAMDELRHIRAMEMIEAKKKNNRWSLRQPKKSKAPPVPKAHWDYLLEEMEWMQADFMEERRWKVVEAREFAYQVVEWHLATPEEKASLMIGGRGWGQYNHVPVPGHSGKKREAEVEERQEMMTEDDDVEMLVGQEGEVEGEGEAGKVLEAMEEAREKELEDAKAEEDKKAGQTGAMSENTIMGEEPDAEGEEDADGEDVDAEGEVDTDAEVVGLTEIDDAERNDRENSRDAHDRRGRQDLVLSNGLVVNKRFANIAELVSVREPILDTPLATATVDLDSLPTSRPPTNLANVSRTEPQEPLSLIELFPELIVYAGPTPPENDKKHRREEGGNSIHRMAHTSRIMDIKPILVSTLQPAKNLSNEVWDLHDGPYYEDIKAPTDANAVPAVLASRLFSGTPVTKDTPRPIEVQKPPAHHLRAQLPWSEEEDTCLLKLVAMFSSNWELIADAFNTEMIIIPVEKRNSYECWERWYYTFGEGRNKPRLDLPPPPSAAALASAASVMTGQGTPVPLSGISTPGLASAVPSSAASHHPQPAGGISVPTLPTTGDNMHEGAPPPPGMSKRDRQAQKPKYEGTKRSVRHQAIYDAVKRMNRRREGTRAKSFKDNSQKKIINVHESHSMTFPHVTAATPWELVEAKYQRDVQINQQRQQRAIQEQQRQLALRQQQAMMTAQQQAQMRPTNIPNMPNAANVPQQRLAPNGQPIPNIAPSQQQLLNAVAAATAVNRQGQAGQQGTPNVRPNMSVQGQTPQIQQQMLIQAQQMAAQQARALQAQAQAQQQQQQQGRPPNLHGTPHSQQAQIGVGSPFVQAVTPDLPDGVGHISSPAMQAAAIGAQSSPQLGTMGRPPSGPVPPHMRVPGAGNGLQMGSPMGAPQGLPNGAGLPLNMQGMQQNQQQVQGVPMQNPMMNNAAMQQVLATLAANGQQFTQEQLRSLMLRSAQLQAQQAAQVQQSQGQLSHPGTPQMGMQNVPGVQGVVSQRIESDQAKCRVDLDYLATLCEIAQSAECPSPTPFQPETRPSKQPGSTLVEFL